MEVTHDALRVARRDSGALASLLDPLAAEAAAGARPALETLIWAVDELGLAQPVLRGLLVDRADIEDVSQDVLIAVAEPIGQFRGDARSRTWLNQVARFKAIDHLRRKRDEARLDDVDVAERSSRRGSPSGDRPGAGLDRALPRARRAGHRAFSTVYRATDEQLGGDLAGRLGQAQARGVRRRPTHRRRGRPAIRWA